MNDIGIIQLLTKALRSPLEEAVSDYLNRAWQIRDARDMSEYACHPCALLSGKDFGVFAKFSTQAHAAKQFDIESASLDYLADRAGVRVPEPIGVIPVDNGTLFIMKALQAVARGPRQWRDIGQALARMHRVKAEQCGLHFDTYFGPLEQDNTPMKDWATFYGAYRLRPRLKMAVDAGHLPASLSAQVETLIKRLPTLCGPEVTPTLLHGDAQQNNFVSTAEGAYVIDPAIHYGNPELDLAYVDYFQPVPQEVFSAYREAMPIDAGFEARRSLWRISGYLAAVAVEGAYYLGMLADAVGRYL